MINISYFIKPGGKTIMARLSVDGNRFDMTTKVKLGQELFSTSRGMFVSKTNQAKDGNKSIRKFASSIDDKYETYIRVGLDMPHDDVVKYFKGSFVDKSIMTIRRAIEIYIDKSNSGEFRGNNGFAIKPSTLRLREDIANSLLSLLDDSLDFNLNQYNEKTCRMIGVAKVQGMYKRVANDLIGKLADKYKDSTVWLRMNLLITVLKKIDQEFNLMIFSYLHFFKYNLVEKGVETLSREEYDFFIQNHNKIRSSLKSKAEVTVLDYTICALITAARKSDMNTWTSNNLIKVNGKYHIAYRPLKTYTSNGAKVQVPIPGFLVDIFVRNMENCDGKLLPELTSVNSPLLLKKIAKRYDIFQTNFVRYSSKNGKMVKESGPKWKFLYLHMMRATAITRMLESGIPAEVVKMISGHSKNSKSFQRYVNISNTSVTDYYSEYLRKIT